MRLSICNGRIRLAVEHLREIADIAMLVEQAEAKLAKRGPYKKRGQISN